MGAEFKDEPKVSKTVEPKETPKVFEDPKSYEHLSMEERKAMTERMKVQLLGFKRMTEHLGDPALRKQRSKDGRSN